MIILQEIDKKIALIMLGFLIIGGFTIYALPLGAIQSDEIYHACNSIFYYTLLHDPSMIHSLISNPVKTVNEYYARYPELSVGFYAPIPEFMSSLFLNLGFSPFNFRIFILICAILTMLYVYKLGNFFKLKNPYLVVLAAITLPSFFLLSTSLMLDVPFMLLFLASVFYYLDLVYNNNKKSFYSLAFVLLLAFYTRYTFIFVPMLIFFIDLFFLKKRFDLLKTKEFFISSAIFIILTLPFVYFVFKSHVHEVLFRNLEAVNPEIIDIPAIYLINFFTLHLFFLPLCILGILYSKNENKRFLILWILVTILYNLLNPVYASHYLYVIIPMLIFGIELIEKLKKEYIIYGVVIGIIFLNLSYFALTSNIKESYPWTYSYAYKELSSDIVKNTQEGSLIFSMGEANYYPVLYLRLADKNIYYIRWKNCIFCNTSIDEFKKDLDDLKPQYIIVTTTNEDSYCKEDQRTKTKYIEENYKIYKDYGKVKLYKTDYPITSNEICNYRCTGSVGEFGKACIKKQA